MLGAFGNGCVHHESLHSVSDFFVGDQAREVAIEIKFGSLAEARIFCGEVGEGGSDFGPRLQDFTPCVTAFSEQVGGIDAAETVGGFVVTETGESLRWNLEIFAAFAVFERSERVCAKGRARLEQGGEVFFDF